MMGSVDLGDSTEADILKVRYNVILFAFEVLRQALKFQFK